MNVVFALVAAGNILFLRAFRPFDKLKDLQGAQKKIGRAATAASGSEAERPNYKTFIATNNKDCIYSTFIFVYILLLYEKEIWDTITDRIWFSIIDGVCCIV